MSELDLIFMQQRLQVIDLYMNVFGIGFLEALQLEMLRVPPVETQRHPHCRCVIYAGVSNE